MVLDVLTGSVSTLKWGIFNETVVDAKNATRKKRTDLLNCWRNN